MPKQLSELFENNDPDYMINFEELGIIGEKIARKYLENKGYTILDYNWHWGHLELDIIAQDGNEIVIVEVKTRFGLYEEPRDMLGKRKIKNIVNAANAWLIQEAIDLETRFDLISIVFARDESYEISHFEGAFIPPVS
jgi:putative endonuclease